MENQNMFLGAWRMVTLESRVGDHVAYPLGKNPRGYIVYSPDGHMSVMMAQSDRQRFEGEDIMGTPEEMAQAYRSAQAYAGRYEVVGNHVFHHIEASSFPNWTGQTQQRTYHFDGNRLILSTLPMLLQGEVATLVVEWEKADA